MNQPSVFISCVSPQLCRRPPIGWTKRCRHRKLRLGVEACRLVGLDPDQLSLQAPFPEGLAAPMAGSPVARQLAPGGFMLRSGRPACGPVSLLAQESGRFYRRSSPALLFGERPQDLFGLVLFRKGTHVQKDVKKEAFEPDDEGAHMRGPERTAVELYLNRRM